MTILAWSEQLAVGHADMDHTHQEFVDLLNAVGAAEGEAILPALDAFIAHTEAHFAQEEAWMEEKQFPPRGCHGREHTGVLEVVREVRTRVVNGETHYARTLAEALGEWFQVHATSMDTMLALYLENPHIFDDAEGCASPDHVCSSNEPEKAAPAA